MPVFRPHQKKSIRPYQLGWNAKGMRIVWYFVCWCMIMQIMAAWPLLSRCHSKEGAGQQAYRTAAKLTRKDDAFKTGCVVDMIGFGKLPSNLKSLPVFIQNVTYFRAFSTSPSVCLFELYSLDLAEALLHILPLLLFWQLQVKFCGIVIVMKLDIREGNVF